MLNISAAQDTSTKPPGVASRRQRARLIADITAEMAAARRHGAHAGFRRLIGASVSLAHLQVLALLRSEGALRVGDLAGRLGVSVASATGIVSRMESRGLVERARDAGDRRVVRVVLAAGGERALAEVEGQGIDHFAKLLARLGTAELRQLQAGLRALHRAGEELAAEDAGGDGGPGRPAT